MHFKKLIKLNFTYTSHMQFKTAYIFTFVLYQSFYFLQLYSSDISNPSKRLHDV